MNNRVMKLFVFNLTLAILMLTVFSRGIPTGLFSILSFVFIAIVFVVFLIGNILLLNTKFEFFKGGSESMKKFNADGRESKEAKKYLEDLKVQHTKKGVKKYVELQVEQIRRFEKKVKTARILIAERFQETELTYGKFNGAIDDAAIVFYSNLDSVMNKMEIFDGEEYNNLRRKTYTVKAIPESVKAQIAALEEYLEYIQSAIDSNEIVIGKLEKLILEISQLTTLSDEEMKNRSELKELDEFIDQIKLYKKA